MNNDLHRALRNAAVDVEIPVDESYYDNLHDRIMLEIAKTEVADLPFWHRPSRLIQQYGWSFLQLSGGLALTVVIGLKTAGILQQIWSASPTVQRAQNDKMILVEALKSPEDLSASFISYQRDSDFFLEIANHSISWNSSPGLNDFIGQGTN